MDVEEGVEEVEVEGEEEEEIRLRPINKFTNFNFFIGCLPILWLFG